MTNPAGRDPGKGRGVALVLRLLPGLACAALFALLLLRDLDWGEAAARLRGARLSLVAPVLGLLLAHYALKGLRWHALLAEVYEIPRLLALRLCFVGFLFNNFLPARVGELGRPWLLAANRPGVPFGFAVATLLGDKLFDLLFVLLCLVAAALVVALPPQARIAVLVAGLGASAALGIGLAAARWTERDPARARRWLEARFAAPLGPRAVGAAGLLLHVAAGLATCAHPRAFLRAALWTAASFALLGLAMALGMEALGVAASPARCLSVLGMLGIGFILPSLPTGAGSYHWFASQGLLLPGGVEPERALAFAVFAHLCQVLASSIGGLVGLVGLRWGPGGSAREGRPR